MSFHKILLAIVLCINIHGCLAEESYCKKLIIIAGDKNVQSELTQWVAKNVLEGVKSKKDVTDGVGVWPGFISPKENFSWDKIGFNRFSQVNLVGPKNLDDLENIQSVFFGEKSRYGILVKVSKSSEFAVEDKYLNHISSEIAVVCRDAKGKNQ